MALPIDLANTTFYSQGEIRDGLVTTDDLAAWLRTARPSLTKALTAADLAGVGDADLVAARKLRDAIRSVAGATSAGRTAPAADVEAINAQVRAAPTWRELRGGRRLRAEAEHSGPGITAALAEVAQSSVDLLASGNVRACGAPHCVLFFVKDHPRREWCSDGCGNRVRAARHYARTRQLRETAES